MTSTRTTRTMLAAAALCLGSGAAPALAAVQTADGARMPIAPGLLNGDPPSQFPGAAGTPQTQVVLPERTIIQHDAPAVPIVLAGVALVVSLAGGARLVTQRRLDRARTPV
jgi:hypothetical protein